MLALNATQALLQLTRQLPLGELSEGQQDQMMRFLNACICLHEDWRRRRRPAAGLGPGPSACRLDGGIRETAAYAAECAASGLLPTAEEVLVVLEATGATVAALGRVLDAFCGAVEEGGADAVAVRRAATATGGILIPMLFSSAGRLLDQLSLHIQASGAF
jgi:hypothetical protein